MNVSQLTKIDTWNGRHKGIGFQIKKWSTWNYYLYIPEPCIPERYDIGKVTSSDYMESQFLGLLELHCGCTYFRRNVSDRNNGFTMLEIGCDYNHYYDEGRSYNIDDVLRDCIHSIETLYESVPDMKVFNQKNGGFIFFKDAEVRKDGSCYPKVNKPAEERTA